LNKELWDKITIYLNGKLLYSIEVFQNFKIDFLSEVTFIFRKKSFSLDDTILFENEMGNEVFFISSGTVAIIHK
jgi:CRP-like cAMP-binding protein